MATMTKFGYDLAFAEHSPVPECEKSVGVWLDERPEAQPCDSVHL